MNKDILLGISEASKSLGVSEVTLRQWTDEGKIKAFVTPGGHRRYSQNELRHFLSMHRKTLGVRDLVAELEDAAETHREIAGSLMAAHQHPKLTEETRLELARLGRQLMNAVISYITQPAKREQAMAMARETGRGLGQVLAGLEMSLTDSVEMFVKQRDPIVNATTRFISKKEAVSGRLAG